MSEAEHILDLHEKIQTLEADVATLRSQMEDLRSWQSETVEILRDLRTLRDLHTVLFSGNK